jgi:hypothetical protein
MGIVLLYIVAAAAAAALPLGFCGCGAADDVVDDVFVVELDVDDVTALVAGVASGT